MERSKKIAILAHCILNCNSKVVGLSGYKSSIREIINKYMNEDIAIIQLPCPEFTFLGLKRWGMTKEQYMHNKYRNHCRELLMPYVEQIKMYLEEGYEIIEYMGVDHSPSCGVNYSCRGYLGGDVCNGRNSIETVSEEMGVFTEEFKAVLDKEGISISFKAIDEKEYY